MSAFPIPAIRLLTHPLAEDYSRTGRRPVWPKRGSRIRRRPGGFPRWPGPGWRCAAGRTSDIQDRDTIPILWCRNRRCLGGVEKFNEIYEIGGDLGHPPSGILLALTAICDKSELRVFCAMFVFDFGFGCVHFTSLAFCIGYWLL